MTKLSLITTSFNSAGTIADTLHSVNVQTYEDIEYIIIDGGSKDDTLDIVTQVGERVTKVISEADDGIYDAYNKGLSQATGDVIGFINSDDFYCSKTVISRVMQVFENSDVDACHADLVYVHPDHTDQIQRHWKSRPITKRALSGGFIPAHPTVFVRREVYDRVGNFDLGYRLAADYEFLLRTFFTHEVSSQYVPEVWVRMRAGGHTGGTASSILAQNREIRAAQELHGVKCSTLRFYGNKTFDRLLQRARAPFVKAPNLLAGGNQA